MMFVSFNSNTCHQWTRNNLPLESSWFNPIFSGDHVAIFPVFCIVFSRSLFVLFILVIVLSVLQFTASGYPICYLQICLIITANTCQLYGRTQAQYLSTKFLQYDVTSQNRLLFPVAIDKNPFQSYRHLNTLSKNKNKIR